MTPVLAQGIEKRTRFLVDVLRRFPAGPIQAYDGWVLTQEEKHEALAEAVPHGYTFAATPEWCDGWWFIEVKE